MAFGDFLDKALNKASSKLSSVSNMTSKLDSFKSNFDTYSSGKMPTGLGAFGLAMGGGESKSITSGLPALDEAVAEEAGGLFDSVIGGLADDLFGSEWQDAFDAGVAAAGGVAQVMETAGGLVSNMESLGQGLAGESFGALGQMASTLMTAKSDAKQNLVNLKKMFGLTGADIKAMAGGKASEALVNKIADRMVQVDFVTSVPIDMTGGKPSVATFINNKYPTLAEGMPDMGGAVSSALPNISTPIRAIIVEIGNEINLITDINKFGYVMGNALGDTSQFVTIAMKKIDSILTTGTARLQTDFFGNLPDTAVEANKMLAQIRAKIIASVPNPPSVKNAIATEMPDLMIEIGDIVTDLSTTIDALSGYSGTSFDMIGYSLPQIETLLTTNAQYLQKNSSGVFPAVSTIVDATLPEIEKILNSNIPNLTHNIIESTVDSLSGTIETAVATLSADILTVPDIGDPYGEYGAQFGSACITTVSDTLADNMSDLSTVEVSGFIASVQPSIVNGVYSQVPSVPVISSVQTALRDLISDWADQLLIDITPDLETAKDEFEAFDNMLVQVYDSTSESVSAMSDPITDTYTQLQDDYDLVVELRNDIIAVVEEALPNITESLKTTLPVAQASLPNVTEYLNESAGELMTEVRKNIPVFDPIAQSGLANMIDFAQGVASEALGSLTDAATSMLNSVNIPTTIPDISSLQVVNAMKTTMFNIEAIQTAQYGLDMMDKAQAMIPEVEAAIASFQNFSWEGSGFSLGAIGSYFTDISSTEDMSSIVEGALAGCPPVQQASAKITGVINQANQIKAEIEAKKAEAEAAIDSIKEIFSFF